jgi:cytosine/adenosine deaminase-related metal-dependent hydrolase
MPQHRAAWLLPISQPPIRDGWVRTERGRITALGPHRRGERRPPDEIDLGSVAVLPGLVNAHTHLELSWMRGRIGPSDDFPQWIRDVITLQRCGNPDTLAEAAIDRAIAEARGSGTALVGDVSNTLAPVAGLIETGTAAVEFYELIGFKADRARQILEEAATKLATLPRTDVVRYSLAAHAPYSVSPALFQGIRQMLERDPFGRCSVHLGESREETEFLHGGGGAWRKLLEDLGAWDSSWQAPGCDPVEYIDRMGFMTERLLIVHGVQFGRRELERIAGKGATLVTCPRGNLLTGAGIPPIADFYASGIPIALGTDSLASVPDLNLFSELAELRRLSPSTPAGRLLESATINGARALGFESDFGTIEPGKRDCLLAVDLAERIGDVEGHLVAGVRLEDIHWIT